MKKCQIFISAGLVFLCTLSGCNTIRETFSENNSELISSVSEHMTESAVFSQTFESSSSYISPTDSFPIVFESSKNEEYTISEPNSFESSPALRSEKNSSYADLPESSSFDKQSQSSSSTNISSSPESSASSQKSLSSAKAESPPSVQSSCIHEYILISEKPPCEIGGTAVFRCVKCQKTFSKEIPAKEHDYTETITLKATDYSVGIKSYCCKDCGKCWCENYSLGHTVSLGNGKTAVVYGYWDKSVSEEIFALVNEYRRENGLCELKYDEKLSETAKLRALECAYLLSHTRPNGTRCFTAFPKNYTLAGENVGGGFKGNAQKVMNAWKNSPLHNANLLDDEFRYIGTSLFVMTGYDAQNHGGTYFAQEFICY